MNINPPAQTEMAPSELTQQLDTILASVLLLIAAQFRILGIITVPLWNRISRSRQRLARLCASAGDHIEHARGQACVQTQLRQTQQRQRRVF